MSILNQRAFVKNNTPMPLNNTNKNNNNIYVHSDVHTYIHRWDNKEWSVWKRASRAGVGTLKQTTGWLVFYNWLSIHAFIQSFIYSLTDSFYSFPLLLKNGGCDDNGWLYSQYSYLYSCPAPNAHNSHIFCVDLVIVHQFGLWI